MIAGLVFFDKNFHFHDGESGEKLFVILGADKGIDYGCQPNDRFHNFYLPIHSCYLKKNTWICLNEFYELRQSEMLNKRFSGNVNHICDLSPQITREIQNCALESDDITGKQSAIIKNSLIN